MPKLNPTTKNTKVLSVGLVSSPRHGGNRQWAAPIAGVSPREMLDFSANINPLGPPPSALAAIQAHLEELRHYPDPDYRELKLALGDFYGVSPDRVLPGNGAAELLTWIGRELAHLESTVILRPAFGDYDRAFNAFYSKTENLYILNRDFRTEISLVENPQNKGLLLNNPHNPTGKLIPKTEILDCIKKFNTVVIDEAFMDFLPPHQDQSCLDLVELYPNLIILRSLTKFYSLPGLRLGFVVAHPDRLERWQNWRDPWSVNCLAVAAGIGVVKDKEFQAQTWAWLPEARSDLYRKISQVEGFEPLPSLSNFLLIKTPVPGSKLQKYLLQNHKILIRDCLSFAELGEKYIRLAVLRNAAHDVLFKALVDLNTLSDYSLF